MRKVRLTNSGARFAVTNGADLSRITALHKAGPKPNGSGSKEWYKITNLDRGIGVAEIFVYDEIGFWGVSAAEFVRELEALEAIKIDLRINSPGGDVWDGIAIYNALCTHPATVTTYIDGLAASAASFIAQSGAKVYIARNATMMIHDAEGLCIGNAADMEEMAELLNRTSDNIADIYAQRCSTVNVWRKAMKNVSWYVGQEAVDAGLADESYEPEQGTEEQPAERRRRASNAIPVVLNGRTPKPVSTACPSHGTATTDEGSWDADAEQKKMTFPISIANARKMYGWYDNSRVEDGDLPRDACSLPHHVVGDNGSPGAAHMGGVRNALARLPQSDIPDSEQDAVRAHLNKHLEDGGGEPGEDTDNSGNGHVNGQVDLSDFGSWWNPDAFRTAVATAADLNSLYGFSADMFREAIRGVTEDMPALREPDPVSMELEPAAPTISIREFRDAIKRGML